jgi:hypothetical protein
MRVLHPMRALVSIAAAQLVNSNLGIYRCQRMINSKIATT